jgi:Na+-transporting NADH:ubiquinone oxidoreductase subunit B
MKAIKNFFEKTRPHVQKGAKYHWLHSVHDGFFTLFFVQKNTSKSGVHIHDYIDLKRTMAIVVLALVPALLFGMYNAGYQHYRSIGELGSVGFFNMFLFGLLRVLPILIVSYVVGLGVEFIFAQLRGHDINEGFLVSGILIPMVMPVETPLWMVAVATVFAVIFGKEVFGGTGMNIFNPALLARAFLFFAYPAYMTGDYVWIADLAKNAKVVDGFSGATPLSLLAAASTEPNVETARQMVSGLPDLWHMFVGLIPGSIGETSKIAILIGAVILLVTGIGSWRIMLSAVVGGVLMTFIFNAVGANVYMKIPPLQQLLMGSFLFGVVFMATDPVSAAQTNRGKLIYGFLIGMFSILIRVYNPAYPEGTMLAILLMNAFAPLIDYFVVESHIKKRLKRIVKVNLQKS